MAIFKITANSTVRSLSKAFKDEFEATLQIYNGRLKAEDNVKLVDIGAKTGTFECRASRTVGKFVEMMQQDFNLKVKVRTADDWVIVIDGVTLATIKDMPKQCTKAQMDEFLGYQRKTEDNDEKSMIENEGYVNAEESEQESLALATTEYNTDGIPEVSINLIGKYFANYQEAYWSEYWDTNSGNGVVMIIKQNDDEKQLFKNVLYLDAHDENTVNELEIFHDEDEEYCENAMWYCIVFYQTGSDNYSEDVWRNTSKALQLIFKPKRSSMDGEKYEGPEAVFNIKATWSDEEGEIEDSPFYTSTFRIYKNEKDEWVSEQLD